MRESGCDACDDCLCVSLVEVGVECCSSSSCGAEFAHIR